MCFEHITYDYDIIIFVRPRRYIIVSIRMVKYSIITVSFIRKQK